MRDRRTRPKRIPQHKERLGRVAITGQSCRGKVVCTSTSCDFYNVYLAWDPTSEPQWKKRGGFDLCKYLAAKSCFFFQRALPRPRRFFPEARSRHTTAMDGFIWRSPSPPARSTLGENACNRTAYQSKARWSGRAAVQASISAIPTVTLWSLPRLDCGRSTDEERELRLRCLGGGSGVCRFRRTLVASQ